MKTFLAFLALILSPLVVSAAVGGNQYYGTFTGDGGPLTNILGGYWATNTQILSSNDFTHVYLTGAGSASVNGQYNYAGQLNAGGTNFTYTNTSSGYLVVSNGYQYSFAGNKTAFAVTNGGLNYFIGIGVSIGSPCTPVGSWATNHMTNPSGVYPAPTGTWGTNFTTNTFVFFVMPQFVQTYSSNQTLRVEKWGNDIGGGPGGYPFATVTAAALAATNGLTNTIFVGPGQFSTMSAATGILTNNSTLVGSGERVTSIGNPGDSGIEIMGTNIAIENLTCDEVNGAIGAGTGVTNLLMKDVDIYNPAGGDAYDCASVGTYLSRFVRCRFVSGWDTTQGIHTGQFYDCEFVSVEGNQFPSTTGLHGPMANSDDGSMSIFGGSIYIANGHTPTQGSTPANACIWVTSSKEAVYLYGPKMFHYDNPTNSSQLSYAIYNPVSVGNTNVYGFYTDNGTNMWVVGTNYFTTAQQMPLAWVSNYVTCAIGGY